MTAPGRPGPPIPATPPRPATGAPGDGRAGAIRFEVLAEIAEGETARVDLCRETRQDGRQGRLLAVKRLHPHIAADPDFAAEFHDEVWLTASLRHPNVIEVLGWGSDAYGSFVALELVRGVSVARLMKTVFETGEAFNERMVVFVAASVCRGLAAAHALRDPAGQPLGLVHRDLTPGNVLVGFEGEVKVLDFGLAKAKQRITQTLTGYLKGHPAYIAPEIPRGEAIDGRADLFSLGVLLFELLAGRRPWEAESEVELFSKMQAAPPADLRELRPKLDRDLAEIVARLLRVDRNARFGSAEEVAARLDGWLDLRGWREDNEEALGRFVHRNAMRQKAWFERAIAGDFPPPELPVARVPLAPAGASLSSGEPLPRTSPRDSSEEIPTLVKDEALKMVEQYAAERRARSSGDFAEPSTVDACPRRAARPDNDPLLEAPTVPVVARRRGPGEEAPRPEAARRAASTDPMPAAALRAEVAKVAEEARLLGVRASRAAEEAARLARAASSAERALDKAREAERLAAGGEAPLAAERLGEARALLGAARTEAGSYADAREPRPTVRGRGPADPMTFSGAGRTVAGLPAPIFALVVSSSVALALLMLCVYLAASR